MTPVELLTALSVNSGATVLLGGVTWVAFQRRDRPSAWPFIAVVSTLTVWAACSLVQVVIGPLNVSSAAAVVDVGQLLAGVTVPGVWTIYVLAYTGRGSGLTYRRIAMVAGLLLPVVISLVVFAARPPETVAERVVASLAGFELIYMAVLVLYSTHRLLKHGWNHARVSRVQVALLWVAVGAPYFLIMADDFDGSIDSTGVGLLVAGGLLSVVVYRYPVMTGFPKADHVARSRVVEALQEAVIVLDWEDHVLDVNSTATRLFDKSDTEVIGGPLRTLDETLAEQDLSTGATGTVTLQTTNGRGVFQFSVSAVDGRSAPVARTILLRDITDRTTREQRLSVLNRVLRHNVRNKLDVIMAHTHTVDEPEPRGQIRETASDLLALSQKARDAEDVMTESTGSPDPVDLTNVARDVVETHREEYPGGEISLTTPDELPVMSHRTVLTSVLSELVENALEHADASPPTVDVTVRRDDGAAELVVADNGPGIPKRERQILADGAESQLEHGFGIGLWVVNWAALSLGGDLEFSDNEPRGSVVTLRLSGTAATERE